MQISLYAILYSFKEYHLVCSQLLNLKNESKLIAMSVSSFGNFQVVFKDYFLTFASLSLCCSFL